MPRAGTVSLFDLATSKEIEQLPALGTDVRTVVYSPDGTLLVSGSENGRIRVWSCAERRLVRELGDPNDPIYLGCFRADGRRLLSVDPQGRAIWWDTLTWQAVQTFVWSGICLRREAISPDGRLWRIGTGTGALRWLNAETGELLATTSRCPSASCSRESPSPVMARGPPVSPKTARWRFGIRPRSN